MVTDFRGNLLEPGTLVAYNLSGNIAIGRLLEITQLCNHGFGPTYRIKVEVVEAIGFKPGHVSRVKHLRSLMALANLP